VPDGRLILDWIWSRGQSLHIRAEYDGVQGSRPEVLAIVDQRCTLQAAGRLLYDPSGIAAWLEDLDDALQPNGQREALNPPVPAHADPGGLPVAIIDTGVNYLLPEINRGLARDPTGALLGYDFWDLDERPFDVDPRRSAFYPDRHGTAVASIVPRRGACGAAVALPLSTPGYEPARPPDRSGREPRRAPRQSVSDQLAP
jgi:hypothetical protein